MWSRRKAAVPTAEAVALRVISISHPTLVITTDVGWKLMVPKMGTMIEIVRLSEGAEVSVRSMGVVHYVVDDETLLSLI